MRASFLCTVGCAAFLAPVNMVLAEEQDARVIEEIIVTATYRETNLMDTPQAISAVTDSFVEDLGAQSMEDIYTVVPGLSMQGSFDGDNRYTVRGVTSQTGQSTPAVTGAIVGVYLDGTPVTAALGPDNQVSGTLFDIERVEVLKGPQGTLFGEGSQGGTIRYLYKQPDPTKFDFAVNSSLATMEESDDMSNRLDAMVNIPFGDGFALRVTGWRSETAGYIDNVNPAKEDFNTGEKVGGRAALRYDGDSFTITGSIYYSEQETEGSVATARPYVSVGGRIPGLSPGSRDELDIYSLVVEVDFPWASFQSMTSYTDRKITRVNEAAQDIVWLTDFIWAGSTLAADHPGCAVGQSDFIVSIFGFAVCPGWPGLFNLGGQIVTPDGNNIQAFVGLGDSYSERWVQEFLLVSPADQRLRWTAGAFWKDSEDHTQNQQKAGYFPGREFFGSLFDPLLVDPVNTHTDFLEEYAVFGEVSYDLTDNWELTVGVRVSELDQRFTTTDSGTDDTPVSPKLVLSWRPLDELLVYASYTSGFRPGNVNNNLDLLIRQFDSLIEGAPPGTDVDALRADQAEARSLLFFDGDDLDSYELGMKVTLWDGRMQLLTSAYYLDWNDMIVQEQSAIGNAVTLNSYNINSGGAEIYGVELEATVSLTDRLTIRVAGDINDTEVTQAPSGSGPSRKGNELIYAPNHSASVALDYSLPLANGWSLDFHLNRAWVAEQFTDTLNTLIIPSYEKSNGRITLRSADQKWRVALYGTNLENEEILRGQLLDTIFYWHSPRQVGLEVGYQL